jgi:hypothetical protein
VGAEKGRRKEKGKTAKERAAPTTRVEQMEMGGNFGMESASTKVCRVQNHRCMRRFEPSHLGNPSFKN